jgi:hypothetical protein
MGGTELFRANLATGNALPWAIIIKINMKRCLSWNFFNYKYFLKVSLIDKTP